MGRYKETTSNSSTANAIMAIASGGLVPIVESLLGVDSIDHTSKITDTQTGKTGTGHGSTKQSAHDNAQKNLKS